MIRRTVSTSAPPHLDIHAVATKIHANTISLPITIKNEYQSVETLALIDSGAGGQFIHRDYVKQLGLSTRPLEKVITAWNVDGTTNKTGTINTCVDLTMEIDGKTTDVQLLVTGLGSQKIILGFPWLNEHNPDINWKMGTFKWRTFRPLKVKRYHNEPAHSIRTVKTDNLEVKLHSDKAQTPTRGSPDAAGLRPVQRRGYHCPSSREGNG